VPTIKELLQLLIQYELLFDGTLGDSKTKPVSFQVKDEQHTKVKLSQCQNTSDTLMKKVARLCKLGVPKQYQVSK
jgi:hypothetical protein